MKTEIELIEEIDNGNITFDYKDGYIEGSKDMLLCIKNVINNISDLNFSIPIKNRLLKELKKIENKRLR